MNWFLGFLVSVVSFSALAMQPLTDKEMDGFTAGKAPPAGKPAVVCCQSKGSVIKGIKKPALYKP